MKGQTDKVPFNVKSKLRFNLSSCPDTSLSCAQSGFYEFEPHLVLKKQFYIY